MATLSPVRFYTPQDVYFYEDDNRPLEDLSGNILAIAQQADELLTSTQQLVVVSDSGGTNGLFVISDQPLLQGTFQAGTLISVTPAKTNTGPSTLSVNASTPLPILSNGNALVGGELQAGIPALLVYDLVLNSWLLMGSSTGTFQVSKATQAQNLVPVSQLGAGTLDGGFSTVSAEYVNVTGNASFLQTLTAPEAQGPSNPVTLGQLGQATALTAPTLNLSASGSGSVELEVGQTAYYVWNSVPASGQPLGLSCASGQIYEMRVLVLSCPGPVVTGMLLPNGTTYSNAFSGTVLQTSNTNQGQIYAPTSSVQTCFNASGFVSSGFVLSDAYGGCGGAPYIWNLRIYTGGDVTPMVLVWGGGGMGASGGVTGVSTYTGSWNVSGDVWEGLGTLTLSSGPWSAYVSVRRVL